MRLGSDTGDHGVGWSEVQQAVDIPGGATYAHLSFYFWPVQAWEEGDYARFRVLRASDGAELFADRWAIRDQRWNVRTYDLLDYGGQQVKLSFGVYNDGCDGITAVYLDDVELCVASNE